MSLDAAQLAQLGSSVGFSGTALVDFIAVALQESGGDPSATNVNADGSRDRGLMQINSAAWSGISDACAYDATCAAQQAYKISNGGADWSAWGPDFTDHRVDKYLPAAQAAVAQLGNTAATGASGAGPSSPPTVASGGLTGWFAGLPPWGKWAALGFGVLVAWEVA